MKKFNVITLILGCVLLAVLVAVTGPGALWRDFSRLGWGLVPLILLEGLADLCHTAAWRHALVEPHRSLPFWRLYRIRLAGSAINYLTPTASIGGEVAKGTLLAGKDSGAEAATGVIVDKLAFALAQLLFTIAGSLLVVGSITLPPGAWPALLGASLLLTLGLFGFFLVQRAGLLGSVARWLAAKRLGGRPVAAVAGQLTAVDMAMRLYYRRYPRDLPKSIAWHFAGFLFGIAQAWIFFLLVSDRAILREAVGVCALGYWFDMLSFAIPLDCRGHGRLTHPHLSPVGISPVTGTHLRPGPAHGAGILGRSGTGGLCQSAGGEGENRAEEKGDSLPQPEGSGRSLQARVRGRGILPWW